MEPGREVGGYVVEGLLGQTAWATTYAAVMAPDRYVALKVLEISEDDPDLLGKLESTLVALVNVSHPSVLAPIDAGEINEIGAPFVVTPLAPHPSLAELVSASPLTPEEVRDLLLRLGMALDRAREAGISHLSLKPTNVFVGPPPELSVAVVDFGMHVLRKEETPKDDVHGAARLALFALSGNQAAVDAAVADPEDLAKHLGVPLDAKLEDALRNALSESAEGRFQTVTGLAEAIREPEKKQASDRAAARHTKASQLMPRFKMPERTTRPAPPDEPVQTKTVQMKAFATKQWTAFKPQDRTQKMEPFRLPPPKPPEPPTSSAETTVKTRKVSENAWTELARTRPMTMLGVSAGIAIFGILAAVIALVTRR